MAGFYNERGERVIAIFWSGVLISDDPQSINFTGNVEVTDDGFGNITVDILGGGGGATLAFETPDGTIDGSNDTFTVTHTPLYIVLNGSTYFEDDGYTLSGVTITMLVVPETGSTLRSAYET